MSSLQIIALDGSLNSDFGWAIPIVQEASVCYLLGETIQEGFAADRLGALASSGDITRVDPVSVELAEIKEEEVEDTFACRSFDSPMMALYWRADEAEGLQIDMAQINKGYPSLSAMVSNGDSPPKITLLPVSALIRHLRVIVGAMCGQFVRVLAEDIADDRSFPEKERSSTFAKNGRLQRLAENAYRLAPDRGLAKEAIARKTLLLLLGDHQASVPAWLSAVAPFWGHPPAPEYWQSSAESVLGAAQLRVAIDHPIEVAPALFERDRRILPTKERGLTVSAENLRIPGMGNPGKSQPSREQESITGRGTSIKQK